MTGRPTTALEEELRRLDNLVADWLGLDTEVRLIPIRDNRGILYVEPAWKAEVILWSAASQRWSCIEQDPVKAVAAIARDLPDLVVKWRAERLKA